MADGTRHEADLVVIGIGVLPNVELAAAAGLACENGIVVDEHGRTSDPRSSPPVNAPATRTASPAAAARLESVQNAVDQAKAVAAAILGRPRAYDEVPWFWSDQYEVKLQMVGISTGHDRQVDRGDPASGQFSVCYFQADRLQAIELGQLAGRPHDRAQARSPRARR